jgi:hypothetical protein
VFRSTLDFLAQFSLTLVAVPTGSVSVLIDPAAAILHALIQEHEDKPDPHPQYSTHAEAAQIARQPAGVVFYFAGTSPPAFSLNCNGAAVSRITYAALFSVIGTMYGNGDESNAYGNGYGSTKFNLPDLRGEFIRGWDDGRGVDAGRILGTIQHPSLPDVPRDGWGTDGEAPGTIPAGRLLVGSGLPEIEETLESIRAARADNTLNFLENHPRNVAMMACIYY